MKVVEVSSPIFSLTPTSGQWGQLTRLILWLVLIVIIINRVHIAHWRHRPLSFDVRSVEPVVTPVHPLEVRVQLNQLLFVPTIQSPKHV